MAKEKKPKKEKMTLEWKDHPSLIEVGGKLRLRVLEDFNIENDLPKWKRFQEEWAKYRKELGFDRHYSEEEIRNKVNGLDGKTDAEKEEIFKKIKALMAMDKAVQDDRYDIRGKHEKEVNEAVLKQARFYRGLTWFDRLKNMFSRKKVIPIDIAMDELLSHVELTSTPEMEARLIKLNEIEASMRAAGQYKKADTVKSLKTIIVEEAAVVAAGFTSYVAEDMLIDFLKKSERGATVDFLRYYEEEIPQDVIAKKIEVDKLMVFDNYVVVHYNDSIRRAEKVEKETSDKEEKKAREKRRDPILFGLIKNSRKLYYICDWTTDTDDLTLEKLEKELGVTRGSLVDGSATQGSPSYTTTYAVRDPVDDRTVEYDDSTSVRRMVQTLADHAEFVNEQLSYSSRGAARSNRSYWSTYP